MQFHHLKLELSCCNKEVCALHMDYYTQVRQYAINRNRVCAQLEYCTVQLEISARRKLSPISPLAIIGENFIYDFFSCVKDCIVNISLEQY